MSEYYSKYTGEEVDNKLDKVDILVTDVNDLKGRVVTEKTITNWGFTKNAGTITQITVNGITKNPNNGVLDLGNIPTTQDLLKKQNILKSGVNIKTFNGESILGSGNINIDTKDNILIPRKVIETDNEEKDNILPNIDTVYIKEQSKGKTFILTVNNAIQLNKDNKWIIKFTISDDVEIGEYKIIPDFGYHIKWLNGENPTFEAGKSYEFIFKLLDRSFLGFYTSYKAYWEEFYTSDDKLFTTSEEQYYNSIQI